MAAQENQESTTEKFELPSDGRMVLRTENLVKKYGKRTVVSHVSINVKQGEIVGLLGPNGAGKTTSFYMTTGLIVPNEGHIYLNDKDITSILFTNEPKMASVTWHRKLLCSAK